MALANRTGERIGVVLTVDGLNAISGERDTGRGRMYVLDPWQRTTVRGWRTSLREVRQFTFVDEAASYAARSGKANEKMGWIEIAVYRERAAVRPVGPRRPSCRRGPSRSRSDGGSRPGRGTGGARLRLGRRQGACAAPCSGGARARVVSRARAGGPRARPRRARRASIPRPHPSERITLRYEYRPALVALGVLPRRVPPRDRLWEREHAEPGFAQPPRGEARPALARATLRPRTRGAEVTMFRRVADFRKTWEQETESTLKVLGALTDASLAQAVTPDDRTLGRLAWHLATTLGEMMERTGLKIGGPAHDAPPPTLGGGDRRRLRDGAKAVATGVAGWSDATLEVEDEMYGERWPRGITLQALVAHQAHHRGQMTVLMRQAGLKVPGVYGPSREEWTAYGMQPPAV